MICQLYKCFFGVESVWMSMCTTEVKVGLHSQRSLLHFGFHFQMHMYNFIRTQQMSFLIKVGQSEERTYVETLSKKCLKTLSY